MDIECGLMVKNAARPIFFGVKLHIVAKLICERKYFIARFLFFEKKIIKRIVILS
jgi:hypothetical protein